MDRNKINVFIVDDHPIVREGLIVYINREPDLKVCGESEEADQALESIVTLKPDVVIVDLSLKGKSGLYLIKEVARKFPVLPILVLSMLDEMIYAERALKAGASGYIMKQEATTKVLTAIKHIMDGKVFVSEPVSSKVMNKLLSNNKQQITFPLDSLSDREFEAFRLMGSGFGTRQISEKMKIGYKTAETYRSRIKLKLGLKSSSDMLQYAIQWILSENREL